ncbi:tetratricopeptide repeat protein [Larkinella arboricola]|uniref:Tetratricopeptide repeat protein n=1 Tax=Larkinella arboricola TaxID=643671 RepID=A0A327WTE7_LARAB|nr:tetratricopeptide repeat protein [Larkinella arboricola]RAJ95594.1 tetratricopeptide repeat protein [Larkinella arboricola]
MQGRFLNRYIFCHSATARFRTYVLWVAVTVWLCGCSQYSTKKLPVAYHNLNARFNAYLIARDRLREVERYQLKTYQENYNQPLPILLPLDSTKLEPVKAQLDDAIKKASLVAERHQNSKWLDNSYLLLGMARLYRQDYGNAMEVFKYVNTKGEGQDEKHEALIGLMRTYIEVGDYTNGLSVAEYLRAQPLNNANTRNYYLTKAYLHQKRQEYAVSAALLDATFPLLKKGETTARLHLIAGQMYDLVKKPEQALEHYRQVLRNRPNYEQSFYATIYSIQGGRTSNERFSRMLNDRKNNDLRDKIYYTMGLLEARNQRYPKAIEYWKKSIRETTTNTSQIPYTYQEMGKVYFENLQDYPTAKAYYDSALALLPQQSADYRVLADRKVFLDEFVEQQRIIQVEDSLQRLAQLNPAALDRKLDEAIDLKLKQQQELIAQAQTLAAQAANRPATSSDIPAEQRWVLYNPILVTQGRAEFTQKWGNRPLEDNWRRIQKETAAQALAEPAPQTGSLPNGTVPEGNTSGLTTLSESERKAQKDALYAAIPLTPEALRQSNQRLEDAYYRLGKLYKFQFNQPDQAIPTFETLLNRYPNTAVKPEVYYLLMLSNDQLNRPSSWKEKLLAEFPTSSYARQVGKTGSNGTHTASGENEAQRTYTQVYNLYKANNVTEALSRAEASMSALTGSLIEDKMALLRVILIGKVRGVEPYRQALIEFIRDYPASPLLPKVKEMQVAAEQPTAKRK